MATAPEFEQSVRDDVWGILSRTYKTVRRGGHPLDAEEHLRDRPFWPDMRFETSELVPGRNGGLELRIVFRPAAEASVSYGYKVDIDTATAAWSERIGVREPRQNPSMFAAELIWYMIAYIGVVAIEECQEGEGGVRWINDGTDVFKALPGLEEEHAPTL